MYRRLKYPVGALRNVRSWPAALGARVGDGIRAGAAAARTGRRGRGCFVGARACPFLPWRPAYGCGMWREGDGGGPFARRRAGSIDRTAGETKDGGMESDDAT